MDYLVKFYKEHKNVYQYFRLLHPEDGIYLNANNLLAVIKADDICYVEAVDDAVCKLAEELARELTMHELDELSAYDRTIEDLGDIHYKYGHVPAVFYEAVEDAKAAVRGM